MTALTTLTGCSGGDHKKQTKPRVCPIHSQEVRTAILDRMNLCVPPEVGILHTPRLIFGWSGVKAPTLTALTALTGGGTKVTAENPIDSGSSVVGAVRAVRGPELTPSSCSPFLQTFLFRGDRPDHPDRLFWRRP